MFRAQSYFRLSCALSFLVASTAMAGTPVVDGRQMAIEACGACHQVDTRQKRPDAVPEGDEGARTLAPTFAEIADSCLSGNDLRSRIANPHYPMRQQEFLPLDLDDLSIYIRSLARRPDCAIR